VVDTQLSLGPGRIEVQLSGDTPQLIGQVVYGSLYVTPKTDAFRAIFKEDRTCPAAQL
jgi:hypothetical protein